MLPLVLPSIFAAALCVAAPAPAEKCAKLPLARRGLLDDLGVVDPATYFDELESTIQKYVPEFHLPASVGNVKRALKRASATEPLQAQVSGGVEEDYYGAISVGATSPQSFLCDFDTGSADLFVPGPQCSQAQGCNDGTKYDQGGTDEGNTTTVVYGSGQISGENYLDDVVVAGLRAKGQNVISLTKASGFSGSTPSSLMGMGFSTIANSGKPTYFETLMKQGVVSTPEFSFYLGRAADGTDVNSELTLGGRDKSKFQGRITQVPVTVAGYWQVALDGVLVYGHGGLIPSTRGQAAIDTGTTIVLAPTQATRAIYSRIPGSFQTSLGGAGGATIWAYPCNANPVVQMGFAGRKFAIDPRDFNLGQVNADFANFMGKDSLLSAVRSGNYCLGAISGYDIDPSQNLYVVGDTFLKNWYSIYNYANANSQPSVSFAKAV